MVTTVAARSGAYRRSVMSRTSGLAISSRRCWLDETNASTASVTIPM
jgi:hypothetical protein